jgi:tryptophan-rich sensory protein
MMHFLRDWAPTLISAGSVTVLAFAGMMLTKLGSWYYGLKKPSWQPPDWLFGPAWTTIFILEAAAAVIAWDSIKVPGQDVCFISTFIVNGVFNMLWSLLFFTLRRPDWALAEVGFLWASVLAMIIVLAEFTHHAWLLIVPYLLWVSFASFLNYTIVRLNAPFGVPA